MEQQFKELLEIDQKIKELKLQRENRMIELNMEVWRKIDGYDYAVSSFGNVKNVITGKMLKLGLSRDKYPKVELYKKTKSESSKVHRLVAEYFIENPLNKPCVDHIDCDRLNNNVKNLRYATCRNNARNRTLNVKNTSGVKGVCWHKRYNKWCASIKVNGKIINLGSFDNINDAKYARQEKVNELFGEFTNQCEKLKYNISCSLTHTFG
jgi:hypothetical protein